MPVRKHIAPHARTIIEAHAKHNGVSYATMLARVQADPGRYKIRPGDLPGRTRTRGIMGGSRRRTRLRR